MLEFPHVREVVVRGKALPLGPVECFGPSALCGEHACALRRDGPHIREEVAQVDPLRVVALLAPKAASLR